MYVSLFFCVFMFSFFRITFLFLFVFFFFNDTATTEIYTLSLHDALPICCPATCRRPGCSACARRWASRSEEHTSELQSRGHLVCRLLLEKKKHTQIDVMRFSINILKIKSRYIFR